AATRASASAGSNRAAGKEARATTYDHEECSECTDNGRERRRPARHGLPRWQREQIKVQRSSKYRIDGPGGWWRRVPIQRQRRPAGHHARTRRDRDDRGGNERDQAQDRLHGQLQRLTIDQKGNAGQLAEAGWCEKDERPVEDGEGNDRECDEDYGLQV